MRIYGFARLALGALAALWIVPPALADEITFDDLAPGSYGFSWVPYEYDGFTWTSNYCDNTCEAFGLTSQDSYDKGDIPYLTFPSEPNAVFNSEGVPEVTLLSSTLVVFENAMFAEQYPPYSQPTVTIEGYDDGTLEWTVSADLTDTAFTEVDFGSAPVNELEILNAGSFNQYWLMDNLNYTDAPAVPEPASLALFGAALVALGAVRLQLSRGLGRTQSG